MNNDEQRRDEIVNRLLANKTVVQLEFNAMAAWVLSQGLGLSNFNPQFGPETVARNLYNKTLIDAALREQTQPGESHQAMLDRNFDVSFGLIVSDVWRMIAGLHFAICFPDVSWRNKRLFFRLADALADEILKIEPGIGEFMPYGGDRTMNEGNDE